MSVTEISSIEEAADAPSTAQTSMPEGLWLQLGMPDEAARAQLRNHMQDGGPDLFQSMDFLAGPACEPQSRELITAFHKKGLVGLCGFDKVQKGPVSYLSWAGAPLPQSARLRVDPSQIDAFLTRFSDLAQSMKTDGLFLNGLVADDDATRALLKAGGQILAQHQAPIIELSDYKGLDEFEMSWTGPTRKSRRRRRKALLAAGDVRFEMVEANAMLINQVLDLKKKALAERGLSSQLFRSDDALLRLKDWLNAPGDVTNTMISALYLNDELIAGEIGLVQHGRYTAYLGAMDMAHTKLSPGAYQLEQTIDWACKNGVTLIDLLPPSDSYKLSMANSSYDVVDVFWPLSLKGKLLLAPWLKTIRPSMKQLYQRLPKGLQQTLAGKQIK